MTGLRASWRNGGERKPRVLVADDNALILSNVSSLLATNFDLVAAVTDGRQALDARVGWIQMWSSSTSRCRDSTVFKPLAN